MLVIRSTSLVWLAGGFELSESSRKDFLGSFNDSRFRPFREYQSARLEVLNPVLIRLLTDFGSFCLGHSFKLENFPLQQV